jgi:hypothetical protein
MVSVAGPPTRAECSIVPTAMIWLTAEYAARANRSTPTAAAATTRIPEYFAFITGLSLVAGDARR